MKNFLTRANDNAVDFFDNFFKPLFYDEKFDSMKTDIKETDNGYELEVEMPGFEKGDINISLENEYLTVSAEKQARDEDKSNDRYVRKERSVSCARSFYVGDVAERDVKASYNNGVLKLTLPKEQENKPAKHTIAIE